MKWDDPELQVEGEDERSAGYRALQSWWRETVLGLEPGMEGAAPRGELLPANAVEENSALNFLDARIASYARDRVREVLHGGGLLDPIRLERNLLGSTPLCFNLFGMLRHEPDAAARVLGPLLDLPIAHIDAIEVAWHPRRHPLQDRTAFDAFVAYRTVDARRGFVGVATKYTEPFPTADGRNDAYRTWTEMPVAGFKPCAVDALVKPATNHVWRSALLAVAVRADDGFDLGHVAVLGTAGDPAVDAAIEGFRAWHLRPDELLRAATLEDLVARAKLEPALAGWAGAFERRYLDLSPVR